MSGRVLVVDDNKVIRQLIRVNLELEGFEVMTAADGVECLELVQQVRPDVVTLDAVMPRLGGLRTAYRLRADPRTRGIPVAVISACSQFEIESGGERGEPSPVDAYLAKPFEPAELVRLVRGLIHGGRHELEGQTGEGRAASAAGHAAAASTVAEPVGEGADLSCGP